MPKSSSFKMHPEVVSSLGSFLAGAEGGAKTSVVRNGNSGLTVGSLQIDLSKNESLAGTLVRIGKEADLPGSASMKPSDLMQLHMQIDNGREKELTAFTAAALATKEGKDALAGAENLKIGDVTRAVERECAKAGPDAEAFCNSPEGQRELAAYVHQYGPNDTKELGKFLGGETANLNGKEVRLDGPLTVDGFRSGYRDATKWATENPDAAKGRDGRVDDFNKQNSVAPAPQPGADASEPAAPVNLLAQAMSEPEAAEPAVAQSETRRDESPRLAGPVGAVLGRDDGAPPSARAVKLLQATINDVNHPAAFDWTWSKKGRIDEDGDLGPQTMAGLGRAVERSGGEGAFAHRFAQAGFRDFARRLDRGQERYENLPATLDATFGRLDPDAATGLQDMLNATREELPDHVRYQPLRRDGIVGPVTTDAFRTALYGLGPDPLADNLAAAFRAETV